MYSKVLLLLLLDTSYAILHTVKSRCLEFPANVGNCTDSRAAYSHCEILTEDGALNNELECECEFENFMNIWIPLGCDWVPVAANETVFLEPGCNEFNKTLINGEFSCENVNQYCRFECNDGLLPNNLLLSPEVNQDIRCDAELLQWDNTPPYECVSVEEICILPNITDTTDANVLEEFEEAIEPSEYIIGGLRKIARCQPGFMFSKTFRSEYIMSCTCGNYGGDSYNCAKNVDEPNAGFCITDPNYVEPTEAPVNSGSQNGGQGGQGGYPAWPQWPTGGGMPIQLPQPVQNINIGPDMTTGIIQQILGQISPAPGTLQHLLGVKNSMFSNFMSSLYQAFLYGDNSPNVGMPEELVNDDHKSDNKNIENTDFEEPLWSEEEHGHDDDHELAGSGDHDFDTHHHYLVETDGLSMQQKIWLKKREENMKKRIAEELGQKAKWT